LAAKERHDRRVHLIAPLLSFDVLLAGAAVVVEGNDALSRPRQVGDDEADARTKLAGVPLDLGHHSSPPSRHENLAVCERAGTGKDAPALSLPRSSRIRKFADSPLEGGGFEPSVPGRIPARCELALARRQRLRAPS
jgi:hypothetical protein